MKKTKLFVSAAAISMVAALSLTGCAVLSAFPLEGG